MGKLEGGKSHDSWVYKITVCLERLYQAATAQQRGLPPYIYPHVSFVKDLIHWFDSIDKIVDSIESNHAFSRAVHQTTITMWRTSTIRATSPPRIFICRSTMCIDRRAPSFRYCSIKSNHQIIQIIESSDRRIHKNRILESIESFAVAQWLRPDPKWEWRNLLC